MIRITTSSSSAEIDENGANLISMVLEGKDIIKPPSDEHQTHGGSAVLIPYGGRVRNAEYTFEGKTYELPKNDGNNSIHGFLKDLKWTVKSHDERSAMLSCDFSDTTYPSSIHTEIMFSLGVRSLDVSTSVTNTGDEKIPLVVGFHPYFLTGDKWRISHTERLKQLNFEDSFFPDGTYKEVDFNLLKNMQDMDFNSCYTGGGVIVLEGEGVHLSLKRENMPYIVIYNGTYSEGKSVAIEPMSGAPDAFNNGIGLVTVDPGNTFRCSYGVELIV